MQGWRSYVASELEKCDPFTVRRIERILRTVVIESRSFCQTSDAMTLLGIVATTGQVMKEKVYGDTH